MLVLIDIPTNIHSKYVDEAHGKSEGVYSKGGMLRKTEPV